MLRFFYTLYTWLFFAPLLVLATVFFGAVCLVVVPFLGPRQTARITGVPWARVLLWFTPAPVAILGQENIDPAQSYVVVANHLSHYDIWVLYGYLPVDFRWVMKQELRRVPVIGVCCATLGHVFIDRSDHGRAMESLEEAKRNISNGTSIIFFPEGTRSRDGHMRPFKKGAFRMAQDLQLPVLPVTIEGTHAILPSHSLNLKPGSIRLVIHPPLPAPGDEEADLEQTLQAARQTIAAGSRGLANQGSVA